MKSHSILLSVCLMLLPCAAEAAPKFPLTGATISLPGKGPPPVDTKIAGLPVTLRGSSVIIDAEANDTLSQDALTPLAAVLKAYPGAHSVDLSWYDPIFLDATGADVLYDRVKHTVTVNYYYGGGEDPEYAGTVRFTHVRESVLAAILRAHPKGIPENDPASDKLADAHNNNAAAWGGFQFLYQRRYRCRSRVVKAKYRMHS